MTPIVLVGFPLPPSFNEQHMPSRGRLVKTRVAREYDAHVAHYQMRHHQKLLEIRNTLGPMMEHHALKVNFYFMFHKHRLFTKTKRADSWCKSLDATNRIKSAQDAVARVLGIDDKFHFQHYVEKVACENSVSEQVVITLELARPREFAEVMQELLAIKGKVQGE